MKILDKLLLAVSERLLDYTKAKEASRNEKRMRLEELRALEGIFNLVTTYREELKRLGVRIIYDTHDMIEEIEKIMEDGK